jgi:integrase
MNLYRRANRPSFYVGIPTESGAWIKRSTGTDHRPTAKAMGRVVETLRQERTWDLLGAVAAGSLALGQLYDAYRYGDLDGLRRRMEDLDLPEYIVGWARWLSDRVKPLTRDHYVYSVRTLMPEGATFLRSNLTGPTVAHWLSALPVSGETKRRYFAGLQSFVQYLRQIGVLSENPIRDVTPPRAAPPRCTFLELPDVLRLVEGSEKPYRAMFALAYGAGLEISAILSLNENDVDRLRQAVRAKGTKAWTRDRIAFVAPWAWPHVAQQLDSVTPGERLFRTFDRWEAGSYHRERCRVLGFGGYRLHDSRHHWAVEQLRAGVPVELVARQLGHRDAVMALKVYGRFAPRSQEWDYWRDKVQASQREKWGLVGTADGTGAEGDASATEWKDDPTGNSGTTYDDSWGGTRTRDPGIMSAVL